jgi:hypothetical protein
VSSLLGAGPSGNVTLPTLIDQIESHGHSIFQTTIIMSGRKPMQQTGDSAARKAKLVELEWERERLLEEEKRAEEAEAREREVAAA